MLNCTYMDNRAKRARRCPTLDGQGEPDTDRKRESKETERNEKGLAAPTAGATWSLSFTVSSHGLLCLTPQLQPPAVVAGGLVSVSCPSLSSALPSLLFPRLSPCVALRKASWESPRSGADRKGSRGEENSEDKSPRPKTPRREKRSQPVPSGGLTFGTS